MGVYFSFLNSTLAGIFCHLPFTANFSVLPSFVKCQLNFLPSSLWQQYRNKKKDA